MFPAESRCWHVVVLYTGMSEAMLGDVALAESIRPSADAWENCLQFFVGKKQNKTKHIFNYNIFTILGNLRQCLDLDDHVQI